MSDGNDYTQYPTGADVLAFLTATDLDSIPAGLDTDGAAAAAQSEFEIRTGWHPFLASAPSTRYFDPPGQGPMAGRARSSQGARSLELHGGLLDLPPGGVSIGYVPDTTIQAAGNPLITSSTGAQGTVLTLGLQFFLKPDNAQARCLPWTSIDFLSPIRGLPQSIIVKGVWGRVRKLPPDVWQVIVHKAAADLAPQLGLSISEGTYRRKIGDSDKTFGGTGAPAPVAYEAGAWDAQFNSAVKRWRRVTV